MLDWARLRQTRRDRLNPWVAQIARFRKARQLFHFKYNYPSNHSRSRLRGGRRKLGERIGT